MARDAMRHLDDTTLCFFQRLFQLGRQTPAPHVPIGAGMKVGHDQRRYRPRVPSRERSEEHTSELQSLTNLVCRLLLEKKKKKIKRLVSMTNHNDEQQLTHDFIDRQIHMQ